MAIEGIPREKLLWMYETMVTARRFDEKLIPIVKGFYHSGQGQEAVGTGAVAALRTDDNIMYDHRGCTQAIAKGVPLSRIYGDFLGTVEGTTRGKGAGIVHIADPSVGVLGQSGTLGGCFPIAAGAAMTIKRKHTDQVVVNFFGDGTSNRGTFHEAMNYAAAAKLPVIFLCENNEYAISTHWTKSCGVRENIADRAWGYGVPNAVVNGQDPVAVFKAVETAVARARRGEGPSMIEAKTFRFRGHYEGDDNSYRTKEELERIRKQDPIPLFAERLLKEQIATEAELKTIAQQVEQKLDAAIAKAQQAPQPDPSYIFADVWAE